MSGPSVTVVTASAAETQAVARAVSSLLRSGDVLVLAGDLGAGKTAFAQGLGAGLGVSEAVVSPTFTLAREYAGRLRMVHADLYRLDRVQELLDLGLDDLAADDAVLVVEWGDAVADDLGADRLEVRIDFVPGGPDARRLTMTTVGAAWSDRSAALTTAVRESGSGNGRAGEDATGESREAGP